SLPTLALQVTSLVNSYMLWIGTTRGEESKKAEEAVMGGCVARDWACAMPPLGVRSSGTSLLRSSSSDVALGMAQRLARRTNKQIFLSVDVPPTFLSGGGGRTLLEVERAAIGVLRELEG
ncbi:uncharacterized protein STEHIDRAFT_42849, partial [Stereum hirsutum FP-91666 SS1]|uniref:uncharacterized protein n=1 Tax=Stereum hirsutum (strain FP-91666) TaxID=721885 RepID=UPI0004449C58